MFREAGDWFAMTSLWISRDTLSLRRCGYSGFNKRANDGRVLRGHFMGKFSRGSASPNALETLCWGACEPYVALRKTRFDVRWHSIAVQARQ